MTGGYKRGRKNFSLIPGPPSLRPQPSSSTEMHHSKTNLQEALHLATISWWLLLSVSAQQSRIVTPPKSVDAALNITVHFTCTAFALDIEWEVNGETITPDLRNRGFDDSSPLITLNSTQNLHMSTLAVLRSADNNGSNITCVAVSLSAPFIVKSEPAAVLLVFKPGLSGPVSNLTVTLINSTFIINSTTFLISWSPPFTLEGVPILGYNVIITNTTSGENETMLLNSTGYSDPQTSLLYSIDHHDPEYNFIITVVPINEVGAGQPATLERFSQFVQTVSTDMMMGIQTSYTLVPSMTTAAIKTSHIIVTPPNTSTVFILSTTSMMSATVSLTVSTNSQDTAIVPALITITVVAMITNLGLVTTIVFIVWYCVIKKHKINRTANKTPGQDLVPVRDNPAYQVVNLNRTDHNGSEHLTTHEVSPQYKNIEGVDIVKDFKNVHDYENVQQ